MKIYSYSDAPNPRRVLIFAAEKGIALDVVEVDIRTGEQKSPAFLARNPSGKIPVLELDDGTHIAESVAISRYLEALEPEPNLFGSNPREIAAIEMQHRFIELELFSQVGVSWVNGPIIAATGMIEPIVAAKARSDQLVNAFYARLNAELGEKSHIAGNRFTIADITALCCIDFAASLVGLKPASEYENIWAWHGDITARDSIRRSFDKLKIQVP